MSFVVSHRRHPSSLASRAFGIAVGLILPVAHVTVAFAQAGPPPPGGGGGGGAAPAGGGGGGAPGGGGGGAGGVTSTTTFFPGGVAPPPPGGVLGGGNAQFSSSKPITGNERDTFDFNRGGSTQTVRGSENSSFVLGEVHSAGTNANFHLVRKGDTLWAICDFYFRNPYQWPRIWSFNPQIQNPHWIFPGDQVRLRQGTLAEAPAAAAPGTAIVDRRRQVPPDTIFLRTQGYIDDDTNNWGEISGSREDKMILSDNDEVYLRIATNHDLRVGQELTVFRPVRNVRGGKVIEIQGTVTVDQWNPKERVARARITETLDAIERGARVGPLTRRYEVVPPVRNDKDVTASVLTSVHPFNIYGQNQVVFLDQGEEAGLKPGNRLFVLKKGDAYHQSLTTKSSAKRIALEDDSPAAIENIPRPRNESVLPEEVQAELRIINVRKNNSMAIVTSSRREIESGDLAFARKGY